MVTVAIALGSNLGDRESHLDFAAGRLSTILSSIKVSRWYETEPVGVGAQPPFLNGAAVGSTTRSARELMDGLLAIERERGRERPFPNAARTLDLDLIFFGDRLIDEPDLTVPHPRFRQRSFVLVPLAEIAPEMRDPVTGRTVQELMTLQPETG